MTFRSSLLPFCFLTLAVTPALAQNAPRELNTRPQPAASPPATRAAPPPALNTMPILPDSARAEQERRRAASAVETTRFSVGLKDGRILQAYDVETKQPLFGKAFLLLDGEQRLELNTVRYYNDATGHYVRTVLPGRSTREATLHRDRVGRISLYSITSTQYSNGSPYGYSPYGYGGRYGYGGFGGFGGPMYRTTKTEYFSKDNGPIEDLSLRNLSIATADFAPSRGLLEQARKYQTYTTLSYVAAGGLMAAGLVASFSGGGNRASVSPLVYAGVPLFIVPLIMQGKQQRAIRQAITLYNRGE